MNGINTNRHTAERSYVFAPHWIFLRFFTPTRRRLATFGELSEAPVSAAPDTSPNQKLEALKLWWRKPWYFQFHLFICVLRGAYVFIS